MDKASENESVPKDRLFFYEQSILDIYDIEITVKAHFAPNNKFI